MRFLSVLCVLSLVAMSVPFPASGLELDVGGSEVSDLENLVAKPFGVRNLGMGWGGVADGTVAANLYYNPANLISHGGFEFAGETQNWFSETDFYNIGAASRFRFGDGPKKLHLGAGLWYARQENVDVDMMPQGDGSTRETTDSKSEWVGPSSPCGSILHRWMNR